MATPKYIVISLLCCIFIVGFLIFYKPKEIPPPSPISTPSQCPPLSPQTCLKSYNASILRQSLYHPSMVHNSAPATL
ncbi:unnamed protein product, partial [Rotaria sp. Silwood1]